MKTFKNVLLSVVSSLLALIGSFLCFIVILYSIKLLSGLESDTKQLVSTWFSVFFMLLFPALICIWANTIQVGSFTLSNPETEGFLKKLRIWVKAFLAGFITLLFLDLVSVLAMKVTNNFGLLLGIKFMGHSFGVLVAVLVAVLLLRRRVANPEKVPRAFHRYLQEVELILKSEREINDLAPFQKVCAYVLGLVKSDPDAFELMISQGRPVPNWVYSVMGNHIADQLETGTFHVYRGVLNEPGNDMLKRYDRYSDKLVTLGDISEDDNKRIKQSLRDVLKTMG